MGPFFLGNTPQNSSKNHLGSRSHFHNLWDIRAGRYSPCSQSSIPQDSSTYRIGSTSHLHSRPAYLMGSTNHPRNLREIQVDILHKLKARARKIRLLQKT
ncbi:MAG: hypothetical protein JXA50_02100 [Deltaproteobacteria bacterium]|nr:hypothetical protein [Deltaproteobacteria bacterium]